MKDELASLRGMSEPFFFSANSVPGGRTVVIHSVVFSSFEVPAASQCEIKILADDVDPRMKGLLKFLWSNYLTGRRKELERALKEAEKNKRLTKEEVEFLAAKLAEKHVKEDSR